MAAVKKYGDVLARPEAKPGDHLEALRFFVHFLGDLHQPLHVTHPDGAHGKRSKVKFQGAEWTEHAIWEEGLVRLRQLRAGKSWRAVAGELAESTSTNSVQQLSKLADVDAWADESLKLGRSLAHLKPGQSVDEAYIRRTMPIVERQLRAAGIRLGLALSRIYGGKNWRRVGARVTTPHPGSAKKK